MPEDTAQPTPSKRLVAVIDIGSSAIRLTIAEVGEDRSIRHIEHLQQHVALGKDVFTKGRIAVPTLRQAIAVIKNFTEVMEEFGIHDCLAIATAAVREATNRDNFVDQVFVRTGIDVEVIEGAEENRLELIAVELSLRDRIDFRTESMLIVEVGAGSTVLLFLNDGEVEATRTLSMGSVRLPGGVVVGQVDAKTMRRTLKRTVKASAEYVGREHGLDGIRLFVAVGSDMRCAGRQLDPDAAGPAATVDAKDFDDFVKKVGTMTIDEIAERYDLFYAAAETFYSALLYYRYFIRTTGAERLIIPMTSMRDGLLIEHAETLAGGSGTDVTRLVLSSAKSLAAKYDYEEKHALRVADLAVQLFDAFQRDHGLSSRDRMLLQVAAVLHEIGMFISPSSRHKHTAYLIGASDIFGLRQRDKEIVANVTRYHRGAMPRPTHAPYTALPKHDRARVSKLASILRIAIALDVSRTQKIEKLDIHTSEDSCEIWVADEAGDLSIEREDLARRKKMFTDFFGIDVVLKQGTRRKR